MLESVLRHIHNRFEICSVVGEFEIDSGSLVVPGAQDGQYVWIEGSVFNDGLHRCPLDSLEDETFDGRVYLLAVPSAVEDITENISEWCADNAETLSSPYQSESFGGYSYTKSASGGSTLSGWQAQFKNELNPYRKLGCEGF